MTSIVLRRSNQCASYTNEKYGRTTTHFKKTSSRFDCHLSTILITCWASLEIYGTGKHTGYRVHSLFFSHSMNLGNNVCLMMIIPWYIPAKWPGKLLRFFPLGYSNIRKFGFIPPGKGVKKFNRVVFRKQTFFSLDGPDEHSGYV